MVTNTIESSKEEGSLSRNVDERLHEVYAEYSCPDIDPENPSIVKAKAFFCLLMKFTKKEIDMIFIGLLNIPIQK